jgi:hypothetical protein
MTGQTELKARMTFFPDLGTETMVASGPHIRAVGWLGAVHDFPTGRLPQKCFTRLEEFAKRWGQSAISLHWPFFMGPHNCELCRNFHASGNFGVPAGAVLFVCPQMIVHYIGVHSYLPPPEFIEAVERSPLPATDEYAALVLTLASPVPVFKSPDRAFYDLLGDERATPLCRLAECERGAITQSVFCRRHHFEKFRGRPCPFDD